MSKNILNKKDLNAAELEYFKSFYFSHSLKETQEHFNISQSTIYKRLEKYGIPRGKVVTVQKCAETISEDELVQVMTFDNTKYNKNLVGQNDWEIIRECSCIDILVIGGKNKLFQHFIKKFNPNKVFSYCDFNKFTGKSYLALGMSFIGYTGPDMKWLLPNGHVKSRTPQKNKELKEQAQAKLFGCGSLKYLYERAD